MKKTFLIACLILFKCAVYVQLPAVFGDDYVEKATPSDMVKTYITPQRIVWQSDDSRVFIDIKHISYMT